MVLFIVGLAVNTQASSYLALFAIFFFIFVFGSSWLTIPYLYSAEITPLRSRHIGNAAGVLGVWLASFLVVEISPVSIENTGWRIYLFFCKLSHCNGKLSKLSRHHEPSFHSFCSFLLSRVKGIDFGGAGYSVCCWCKATRIGSPIRRGKTATNPANDWQCNKRKRRQHRCDYA